MHLVPQTHWLDPVVYRQKMLETVTAALPRQIKIVAVNFAQGTASSYWLLRREAAGEVAWLTLRIANHPLWLKHACQLSILWAAPNYQRLHQQLQHQFKRTASALPFFELAVTDAALLYLLLIAEQNQLVYFVQLPKAIAARHKGRQLDLAADFMSLPLFMGNRNNANVLLQPVQNAVLQRHLARFYGQNLLFSQFKNHRLLALLPTNQWVQPLLQQDFKGLNWRQLIAQTYGPAFWQQYWQLCYTAKQHLNIR